MKLEAFYGSENKDSVAMISLADEDGDTTLIKLDEFFYDFSESNLFVGKAWLESTLPYSYEKLLQRYNFSLDGKFEVSGAISITTEIVGNGGNEIHKFEGKLTNYESFM